MQNHRMFAGLVGAVAVLLLVLGHQQVRADDLAEIPAVETRPLVKVIVGGTEYIAPVFEDIKFTEARREFDRQAIGGLVDILRKLVKAVVVDKKSTISVGKITLGIIPIARKTSANLKVLVKTDTSPKLADGYGKKMSELIFNILATKSTVKLTDEEAARRAFNLIQAVNDLTVESPTGLYLDWRALRIDGELMVDHAGPLIYWAKRNGYGLVLKGFNGLAAFIRSFSN